MAKNSSPERDLPNTTTPLPHPGGMVSEAVIPIEQVLGPHREVILVHAGQRYRLRLTANDRLILTK